MPEMSDPMRPGMRPESNMTARFVCPKCGTLSAGAEGEDERTCPICSTAMEHLPEMPEAPRPA